MGYFIALLFAVGLAALFVFQNMFNQKREEARIRGSHRHDVTEAELEEIMNANQFPVPKFVHWLLLAGMITAGLWALFNDIFFYAESGYQYHVRTIAGEEKAINDVGYNMHLFGRVEPWKKALSVVAEANSLPNVSAALQPSHVTFLDQVDAQVSASARFRLPADEEQFLRMAREYRSQENLLRTTLIPAFQETVRATAALMGADDYFSGSQTQFNLDFQTQLEGGLYLVRRTEVRVQSSSSPQGASNASLGTEQGEYGEDEQVVFKVTKLTDANGVPRRNVQSFSKFGVTIAEARITNVIPNEKFVERMGLKQKAAADRAIAREQRIQEEEQRLLAEAKGQREVAERRADALVDQIDRTTKAETEKQLALTDARREIEKAEIQKNQAQILLDKAEIDAQTKTVAADAEAYEKRVVLEADNALAQKLATLETIHRSWAEAYSKRNVPTNVFGSGGSDLSADSGAQQFMDILTIKAASDLAVDLNIKQGGAAQPAATPAPIPTE